jgi:oligopeptide/dipeptide ABC transporter ATP-binding protein
MPEPVLRVENLRTTLDTPSGQARAVDGISFEIARGQTLAIVGESGCGKSMTALSLMGLVPEPAGRIVGGSVWLGGRDLLDGTWEEMRRVRGREMAMIFQEPMTSLNPTMPVGAQIVEAMEAHGTRRGREAKKHAADLLGRVGLTDPGSTLRQYPHELSGGMRQRVMIAIALANAPKVLIADEPTTALDVTVQAQILDLIRDLQAETGMAVLMITHDLGVVARVAHDVAVMYAGRFVEVAPARELFARPLHPYTRGLLESLPSRARRGGDLATLEGIVPPATAWPQACRFEPRCPHRFASCSRVAPKYLPLEAAHPARCHLYDPEIPDRPQAAQPITPPIVAPIAPPITEAP